MVVSGEQDLEDDEGVAGPKVLICRVGVVIDGERSLFAAARLELMAWSKNVVQEETQGEAKKELPPSCPAPRALFNTRRECQSGHIERLLRIQLIPATLYNDSPIPIPRHLHLCAIACHAAMHTPYRSREGTHKPPAASFSYLVNCPVEGIAHCCCEGGSTGKPSFFCCCCAFSC